MLFSKAKTSDPLPDVNIEVQGTKIQMVTTYKYLGVTLDSQLNYASHIRRTVSNVSLKLRQFRRMRSFLSTKAATLVYKNMLLPMIEYGDVFTTGATIKNRKMLQTLQNKCLRCALNAEADANVNDLHEDADLLKLKFRREQHMLSLMFDYAASVNNRKVPNTEGVQTRSHKKKLLKLKKPRTEKYKKSLSYQGPRKWNMLPEDIQLCASKVEFKKLVKGHVELKSLNKTELMLTCSD